jgi:hypothetical protein
MRHRICLVHRALLQIGLVLTMVVVSVFGVWLDSQADESHQRSTPDFPSITRTHSEQLDKIESDKEARSLFVSSIGPALRLGDAARTLGGSPLQANLTNELLTPDLTAAVHRLMGHLSAWHLASTIRQAVMDQQFSAAAERLLRSPHMAWLDQQETAPWHESLNQLSNVVASPEWIKGYRDGAIPTLLLTALENASRLEVDAIHASYQEWDWIRSWKDHVRGLRGQARLCGTWQWIIHNHQQNHREQKLSLLFPPAGNLQTTLPGLAETIVLGENVYLRWEADGRVQEDSLQFSKEGQRLEGTFVNSQGGWGSVSGKRTAGCAP